MNFRDILEIGVGVALIAVNVAFYVVGVIYLAFVVYLGTPG